MDDTASVVGRVGGKSFSLSAPLYYTAKKFTDDDFVIYEFCAYIYDSKSGYRRWLLFTVEAECDKKMSEVSYVKTKFMK